MAKWIHVDGGTFSRFRVGFIVDRVDLLHTLAALLHSRDARCEIRKPSRKRVEEELRVRLHRYGRSHTAGCNKPYHEDYHHHYMRRAEEWVMELFPELSIQGGKERVMPEFFWFTPQTGVITFEKPQAPSNYKVYKLRAGHLAKVELAVGAAALAFSGFVYDPAFVRWLGASEVAD